MAERKRRSVGRPSLGPPAKRAKISTPAKEPTPVVELAEEEDKPTPLPNKIADAKPLPTLSEPQAVVLSDEEYQSHSSSAVLAASLERSRQRWASGAFFDRYWTKTTTRKDAPPPPPNNPQKSWMKEIGTCSITVDPLVFEATVFFVKEPGMPNAVAYGHHQQPAPQRPPAQYNPQGGLLPGAPSPYGTPYRPQPTYQATPPAQPPFYQSRTLPPIQHPLSLPNNVPDNRTLPPMNSTPVSARSNLPRPPVPPPPPAASTPPATTTKPSPDPVIQMLATRASSDVELKSLMKVVATGNANQDQLRVFQRHIDELTAIIRSKKNEEPAASPAPATGPSLGPGPGPAPGIAGVDVAHNSPQMPAPGTSMYHNTGAPAMSTPRAPLQHAQYGGPAAYPSPAYQQPQVVPRPAFQPISQAPPTQQQRHPITSNLPSLPIVLEFNGSSASADRFLFPPHSILETLSSNSLLASFLVIRKGKDATDGALFDAETEYYEPVTIKISMLSQVHHEDVLRRIRLSVKPADEVRTWMEDKMRSCKRADRRYLAMRLPHKSQIVEEEGVEEVVAAESKKIKALARKEKEATPKELAKREVEAPEGRRTSRVKKSVRISEAHAV